MPDASPFFSIITATYNAAATLPHLLESLAAQTCKDFELVIQDGASTDGTLAVAEASRERLPHLALESGPDKGIYDAWNKALRNVRGEWILFLGADDALAEPDVLRHAARLLSPLSREIFFGCGTVRFCDPACGVRETLTPRVSEGGALLRQGHMPVGHTGIFHRRSLFDAARFDPVFRIAGDYEFLCRTWHDDAAAFALPMTVTAMGAGGISDSPFSVLTARREVFRIMRRHFPAYVTLRGQYLPLVKGAALHILCLCCGRQRSPAILDWLRAVRGLPPVWTEKVKREP